MSVSYAFATLLTSDAYLPGALTVAAALKDVHRPLPSDQAVQYETVCLVTPETVDVTSIRLLRKAFDVVVGVETIVPPDTDSLTLLGRLDLDTALTKLHVFRLAQYAKVIFLDADVLPLRPLSHLFHLDHEFSAVPDVGWPDIFNSGVMVLSPGDDKFKELQDLLNTKGSWDGADQGLLNEWRGHNWNRLSFTYNTTPTAIYTYAPAYQRFGSQISAVHFIGPHKPWHSIAYRAPGSSAQSTDMGVESSIKETPATEPRVYDYGSLVDCWYNVYDRHYRSQTAQPGFQPSKYTSAWNAQGSSRAAVASEVLGLEELRCAALEGMEASGIFAPRAQGEGEYRTMPLEGRFDLMRPRTRAERRQLELSKDVAETPESELVPTESPSTTPEPSTPVGQIISLPSGSPVRWTTLPTPGINEVPPAPQTRLLSLPPTPLHHVPSPYKPLRYTREAAAQTVPPQQEASADLLLTAPIQSAPAVETPSSVASLAATDTYFPKVWDHNRNWPSVSPASSETLLTTVEPNPSETRDAFLATSPIPATPQKMRRREQYRAMSGEEGGSPTPVTPDPTKVKRVFPWEGRPRRTPGRVFPDEGSPVTTPPHPPAFVTPKRKIAFRSPMPSPLVDFPPSLRSHHSPDSSLLQKYTGKLPWSAPSASPLGLENQSDEIDTGSQDGDVEDEVDSEDEAIMRSRSRSASIGMAKGTPKYRSVGVQTDPREVREEGIQVTTFVPVTEVAQKLILMNNGLRRNWPTPSAITTSSTDTTSSNSSPLSPPTLDFYDSFSSSHDCRTPTSPEGGDLSASPSSPVVSPSDYRKGSRVWDPARGIEAFKRGSEEVLAKFMKKGTWEGRADDATSRMRRV